MIRLNRIIAGSLLIAASFFAFAVDAGVKSVTLERDFTSVRLVPSGFGEYRLIEGAQLSAPIEPCGAPSLPSEIVTFEVPRNTSLVGCTFDAEWVTIGENVKLLPIQEPHPLDAEEVPFTEPDAALYDAWPIETVEALGVESAAGKRVLTVRVTPFKYENGRLEAAKKLTVKAEFTNPPKFASVNNRVASGSDYVKTNDEQPDYILIAPNAYYPIWEWYVNQRKEDHPEINYAIVNFNTILERFPINTDDSSKPYARNDAERLHAYIREQAKLGTHYFVLAGAWYDGHGAPTGRKATETRKKITMWTPKTGVVDIGPNNGLPGVYTVPRGDNFFSAAAMPIPSDAFYACCDLPNDAKYPWDEDGNGLYLDEAEGKNDLMPDVVVSRMNIRCGSTWRGDHYDTDYEDIVRDYLKKVRRAEHKDFAGRERYLGSGEKLNGYESIASGHTIRDEIEYYAGAFNLFSQFHDPKWTDGSHTGLQLMRDRMGKETPVVASEFIGETKWNVKYANRDAAIKGAHAQDWELGFVQSHGSQGGATAKSFTCNDAQNQTGLMANFVCASACFMSCPDWTDNDAHGGGSSRTDYCSSLIENRNGGAVFTVGNSRYGWGGSAFTNMETGDGLSQCLQLYFIKGIVKDRLSSGDAWLQAMQRYGGRLKPSTGRWCWAEVMAFGDPLVYRHAPKNETLTPAEGAVTLPETIVKDVAVTATQSTTLSVAAPSAAMSLKVNQGENDTFTISGNETLRVSTNLVVSAGNLTIAAPGGVGHDGIVFTKKGDLRLAANTRFYPAKIVNAGTVTLAGSNALLDFRPGAMKFDTLAFEGRGVDTTKGNILRGTVAGALTPYLPLSIENQEVRLETINAFKDAMAEKLFALKNARLVVGTNPNFGLGYNNTFETFTKTIELDNSELRMDGVTAFTFGHDSQTTKGIDVLVKGNSEFTSANAGHLGLIGKSRVLLNSAAMLEISSEMKDMGEGGLIFSGPGRVNVTSANALAGEVEIGSDVTIAFARLPLSKVTKLTIKAGAKVILPKNASGSYQITPLVGAELKVENGAVFYKGDLDSEITGATVKPNGSLYDTESLLVWKGEDNAAFGGANWTLGDKTSSFVSGRGALFPTIKGATARTINVGGDYLSSFAQFANEGTAYRFAKGVDSAALTLSALAMGGSATFEVPLQVTGSLDVMGGELRAKAEGDVKLALNAHDVHVYPGATLGATRAGASVETFKFFRIYFLAQKNASKVGGTGVRLEEICFHNGNDNLTQGNIKTVSCVGARYDFGSYYKTPRGVSTDLKKLFDGGYDANSSVIYDDLSVFIRASSAEVMSEGKVYLEVELSNPKPLFDTFGVFAAKYTYNGSSWDGYQPTQFRVEVSMDGNSWFTAFEGGSGSVTNSSQNPQYFGGWIGSNYEKSFNCQLQPKRAMELELMSGATLLAEGSYHANITAADGAILKAVEGGKLVTDEIAWNFPATPIKVDTSAIEISDSPMAILSGNNITFAMMNRFAPIESNVRLTYAENTISVVSGDGYKGPYTRTLNGTELWNAPESWWWTGLDENGARDPQQFANAWSKHKLAENVNIELDLAADAVLKLDTNVICDVLMASQTNSVSGFTLKIADAGGSLKAQTLDFTGFSGEVTYEPNCGAARVIAGTQTRLSGGGSGTLFVDAGMTAILTKPWSGTIEGEGTIVLKPENGIWDDLSVLKLTTPTMIKLEGGTMSIPEGTQIDAQKLVVGAGGKIETTPKSGSWVLAGKTVEVEKGGRLEISMENADFANKLDFSKISGAGKLVYVNKSAETVDIPNKPYDSSLELVLSGGKFAAESYLVRHIRFTFLEPNGGNAKIARLKIYKGSEDVNLNSATFSGVSKGPLLSRDDVPSGFNAYLLPNWYGSVAVASDRSKYLDIRLNNPIAMFDGFGIIHSLASNQALNAFEVSVSYDGVNYITVGSASGIRCDWDIESERWAASLPANTDVPGVTVERGAQLVYRDGKIVEERVSRVPRVLFR